MGTIRFSLRSDKLTRDGKAPIELVYQVHGQRKYFRTKEKVYPANWDPETQEAIYLDKRKARKLLQDIPVNLHLTETEIRDINRSLENVSRQVEAIEKRYELDKIPYSASMVIDDLKAAQAPVTKKEEARGLLFDFMDQYIQDHSAIREKGSLQVYRSVANHLRDFQQAKRERVTFTGIDFGFFQRFQTYLIDQKGLGNITVAKALSTLKTFLNYARRHGIEVSDGYRDFKIKRETPDVIALTNGEFQALYTLDLSKSRRLAQIRDVFCFSCVTGLRYSDLQQLRREHIKDGEIRITVKKTKELLTIPLNPYSLAILDKYKEQYRPLPIISNQKMNDYLKELCKLAGINETVEIVRFRGSKRIAKTYPKYELITVHTGRKTFATLSLERGMSAEEVMTITGHRDYKSFKRYVKITEERKKVVMLKAWGEPKTNLKVI